MSGPAVALMVDYSAARPTPGQIHAAGYSGAVRYLSTDPRKNLTRAEATGLLAAGLSIALVWETYATRSRDGWDAGVTDVHLAEAQARALGYPSSCVIFYAVDFDTTAAEVERYFAGVASSAHFPVGVYGSARVVEGITVAPWKWQATAWSAGRVSTMAHLYQRLSPTVAHPISGTDENVILSGFPMWSPIGDRPPRPLPPPHPTGGLTVQSINLRVPRTIVTGPGVPPMQRLLGVTADGQAGPITRARLGAEQLRLFKAADYEFGPVTASALLAGR